MAENPLTDLQVDVLRVFFSLAESDGFVLAGGAGLVAVGLSERRIEDLDLFTSRVSVELAADALEAAMVKRSWQVVRIHDTPTFRRLAVTTQDHGDVLVDLARDSGPLDAPTITAFGPTYPAVELAARKLLALFGRAAPRDFIDVATVSAAFRRSELIDLARRIDADSTRTSSPRWSSCWSDTPTTRSGNMGQIPPRCGPSSSTGDSNQPGCQIWTTPPGRPSAPRSTAPIA